MTSDSPSLRTPEPPDAAPGLGGPILSVFVALVLGLCYLALPLPQGGLGRGATALRWLGQGALLLPAGCLLGLAALPRLTARLVGLQASLVALGPAERARAVLALFLGYVALALFLHNVVLLGMPITDDEYGVRFGGQVLAMGRLSVPLPQPIAAIPHRFFWLHPVTSGPLAGQVLATSFDWPGAQVVWAIGETLGASALCFALFAALPVLAIARIAARRLGPSSAAAAALLCLCSPMTLALSATSHAQLVSRGLFALALDLHDSARDDHPAARRRALLAGLCYGLAATCRPPEILFLALPLLLSEGVAALQKKPGAGARLGALVVGGLPPVLLFFLHAYAVSGSPLPLRFSRDALPDELPQRALWQRFSVGVADNLLLTLCWCLSPLGVGLLALGVTASQLTLLLFLGVLLRLALPLLHDVISIDNVGPIHFSEAVVPLLLIAAHGATRLWRWLRARGINPAPGFAVGATGLCLSLLCLGVTQLAALHRQVELPARIYQAVEEAVAAQPGTGRVVVLAPFFDQVAQSAPGGPLSRTDGRVYDWRRPRPDFSEDLLILHDTPGWEKLRPQLKDRRFFRLRPWPPGSGPFFTLEPL